MGLWVPGFLATYPWLRVFSFAAGALNFVDFVLARHVDIESRSMISPVSEDDVFTGIPSGVSYFDPRSYRKNIGIGGHHVPNSTLPAAVMPPTEAVASLVPSAEAGTAPKTGRVKAHAMSGRKLGWSAGPSRLNLPAQVF